MRACFPTCKSRSHNRSWRVDRHKGGRFRSPLFAATTDARLRDRNGSTLLGTVLERVKGKGRAMSKVEPDFAGALYCVIANHVRKALQELGREQRLNRGAYDPATLASRIEGKEDLKREAIRRATISLLGVNPGVPPQVTVAINRFAVYVVNSHVDPKKDDEETEGSAVKRIAHKRS